MTNRWVLHEGQLTFRRWQLGAIPVRHRLIIDNQEKAADTQLNTANDSDERWPLTPFPEGWNAIC